ncbi:MAG TPA: polysaccharide biosynthesis/export family protein [Pyrinomonadaceae bacterium]|nr:polysaccharide biosynthesis/export family protein [Pyrinomonadaceae bacterium]
MKKSNQRPAIRPALALAALILCALPAGARQQGPDEPLIESKRPKQEAKVERQRRAEKPDDTGDAAGPGANSTRASEADDAAKPAATAPSRAAAGETGDDVPQYTNFLRSYRLGPEDVISVTVFGLDRYSKAGIIIPPDGRIDYYHIPEGVQAAGKTTRELAEQIKAHLEEYIIDPRVTVSLEKAVSHRFGVIGDVARPGIMVMSRRLSVYEALNEAGGVLPTGDKKKVVVLRWNADRVMERQVIDIAAIEKGRLPDNYFLQPGDQVFVPGNRYKTVKEVLNFLPIVSFARIFTGGF